MIRRVLSFTVCTFLVVVVGVVSAADEGPIDKMLSTAREEFDNATAKARAGLLAELKKREGAAQKAGDLKTLEKIQAEAKAFEDDGTLPKSVSTKGYEGQMRIARARMETGYEAAVKQYTKDGKIALAKAVQQELDEFKKGGPIVTAPTADPFPPKSVWVNETPKLTLTVLERKGETFRAMFEVGDEIERDVKGTVKDGKVSWLAKDVRAVRGAAGGDNHGTISGEKIDFVWRDEKGNNGTFTLRLKKGL